eukprot:6631079-Ditylum_brightwellii.AAC.1
MSDEDDSMLKRCPSSATTKVPNIIPPGQATAKLHKECPIILIGTSRCLVQLKNRPGYLCTNGLTCKKGGHADAHKAILHKSSLYQYQVDLDRNITHILADVFVDAMEDGTLKKLDTAKVAMLVAAMTPKASLVD